MAYNCFSVLVVCTANICRSPATALLLASSVHGPRSIAVSSAGTRAMKGREMAPAMQERLPAELSLRASAFRSTTLTTNTLLEADLILTMTRSHRSDVVSMCPSVVRNAFTLREFARLLGDVHLSSRAVGADSSESLTATLRRLRDDACRGRGMVPAPGKDDDIHDPPRMSRRECRKVFERISESVEPIALAFEQVVERHDRELLLAPPDYTTISSAV